MEWEYYEDLGFVMSDEEDEGAEFVVAEKFLDGVPDELINQHIWPRLFELLPVNSVGKLVRPLTQAEHKGHIRVMCVLRRVCRGWNRWVRHHDD
jgi:hypothetical protein